jgi:predicted RNA binding protein YcfA (HicA-like mRNA interferase family)
VAILADVSGPEVIKAFRRAGWRVHRQSGSHAVLLKEGVREAIVIREQGGRPVQRGLLLAAIRIAGLTAEEFRELL